MPDPVARSGSAFALWVLLVQFSACLPFGVPLKEPVAVKQQVQRKAELHPVESTRGDVRTVLGEPLLQSDFWGFDLYRAEDTVKEIEGLLVTVWPVPFGVFASKVEGYVLIAYDNAGRIVQVASDNVSSDGTQGIFRMLRARDLTVGIDRSHQGGLDLMADADRLQAYLASRRLSGTCPLFMACDEDAYRKWQYETCPDRVAIDDTEPFDPRPLLAWCEPAKSCPPDSLRAGNSMWWVPAVHPVMLQPGRHRLVMTSSTFQGRTETSFECSAGEPRYGIVRGNVNWHWWSPRSSRLDTEVTFVDDLPAGWASRSILLHDGSGWLVEPEPESP